jgi:glutaminyl-peptide cyclotransferase
VAPTATTAASEATSTPVSNVAIGYRVVARFPHDPRAFTQGLAFHDGVLYEGTGGWGDSSLRRVDLASGEVLQIHELERRHFGEGVTVLGDRIYQITFQSNVAFVYDRETFELLDTFTYPTEGWGLAHDGERLIMSDGTDRIVFRDPDTFEEIGAIDVRDGDRPVHNLNELEYFDGAIWANVFRTDSIVRIDPDSGRVTGTIDLTGLLTEEDRDGHVVDVLNGIAYDPLADRLIVTGKLWPVMYQIELVESASEDP